MTEKSKTSGIKSWPEDDRPRERKDGKHKEIFHVYMRERKLTRLRGYDYSQPGAYFVTVCAQDRNCLFGKVENSQMRLNDIGQMVDIWWHKIFDRYDNISIDEYVIMPNHIHGIINIVGAIPRNRPVNNVKNETITHDNGGENMVSERGENVVSPLRISNTYDGLGQYVSWFKRMSTTEYIRHVKNDNWHPFDKRIWQRNYYEHIIRNDAELNKIRQYIIENTLKWDMDSENPDNSVGAGFPCPNGQNAENARCNIIGRGDRAPTNIN